MISKPTSIEEFKNGTIVFHELELKYMTIQERSYEDDDEKYIRVELFDGVGLFSGTQNILRNCRIPNAFIITVARYLREYKTAMSKANVLDYTTSSKIDEMVLEFIDKYSPKDFWSKEAFEDWKHLFGYKDRLIAFKANYEAQKVNLK
jgi:hypothetical protein